MKLEIPNLDIHLNALLGQVPHGKVTTYRALAQALGDGIAARWVGSYLLDHPHSADCRCYRVVQSTGQVGQFIAGTSLDKTERLRAEGVEFYRDKINLEYYSFEAFVSEYPLDQLRRLQTSLLSKISTKPPCEIPDEVAGVDVSYISPTEGVAAYALVRVSSGKLLWQTTLRKAVCFPYISSYLAFRELPLLLELLERVRAQDRLASVILVDGTGILHPRHAGIASHLGVLANVPTIGVTKKLLCGQVRLGSMNVGETRSVVHDDRLTGVALQSKVNTKPIFLSPGHGVDVDFIRTLVPQLICGHKLPEPLYWADRLSREATRQENSQEPRLF